MEAFLMFGGGSDPEPVYLNLEANANGALLAEYGTERNGRIRFSREEGEAFGCRTGIRDGQWTLSLRLPLAVLDRIYGRKLDLQEGSRFSCNFYKVCETEARVCIMLLCSRCGLRSRISTGRRILEELYCEKRRSYCERSDGKR